MYRLAAIGLALALLSGVAQAQNGAEYSTRAVRDALERAFPDADDLDVEVAGDAVILSGYMTSVADVEHAEAIVRGYAGGAGEVVNLLKVSGDQQIQLEVAFAEVRRSSLREIGLNVWSRGANHGAGLIGPGTTLGDVSPELRASPRASELGPTADGSVPLLGKPLAGSFGAIVSAAVGNFPFAATLSILSRRGFARVLAEPTLVALSGESASFLAGGEFPIPLPQSLGNVGVEFKKFGIQLDFVPTIVGDNIQLDVAVTVSDVDFSLGVKLAQVEVPGLTSRHARSTVRLEDGQSFMIAGLLSDKSRSNVDKVPWLGDLPVLGALFRSSSYRREETELLVVVTAHRVKPLGERPKLPGENLNVDPSDLEFFLVGRAEALEGEARETAKRGGPRRGRRSKRERRKQRREQRARRAAARDRTAPAGAIGFSR